jgi:hypothetical protein
MFVTFRRFIGAITMHALFSKVHTRAFYPPRYDRVKFTVCGAFGVRDRS